VIYFCRFVGVREIVVYLLYVHRIEGAMLKKSNNECLAIKSIMVAEVPFKSQQFLQR